MNRRILISGLALLCVSAAPMLSAVRGQERAQAPRWTYKAVLFPEQAQPATKLLNELAAEGWQYVGPLGPQLIAFKRAEPAAEQPKVGKLSGLVTIDGKPLEKGAISFIPIEVKLPIITATIADGKFATEVPAGRMKVSISAQKPIANKNDKDAPATIELVPARFNTETKLLFEAVPGTNQANFELTSK